MTGDVAPPLDLPFQPPLPPMEAKVQARIPTGDGWRYEPKWDGFRALVFRDRDRVVITSRKELPLDRYFPELRDPVTALAPERVVLDAEIVIPGPRGLDFDALQQRLHPAASRVDKLAAETPASLIVFDVLALGDEDLRSRPMADRRGRLEAALGRPAPPVHLTPGTDDLAVAERWFREFEGAGLDGVVAKRLDDPYLPGERAMIKVKHQRTVDCVVGGFRWHKQGGMVGSLLLGLYDADGKLHHAGHTASFSLQQRRELVERIAPYQGGSGFDVHSMDQPNRWTGKEGKTYEPLAPELVCEVGFDHLQGPRFRHATSFLRWRPDKPARQCTFDQLDAPVPYALKEIFDL